MYKRQGYLNAPGGSLAVYEHFVHGLHRLAAFKDFFEGGTAVRPKPARDHFAAREALWRGMVKGNRLLVAAQNPFAEAGQTTSLPVQYGSLSTTLTLQGREVLLCAFDVPAGPASGLSLSVWPPPAAGGRLQASVQAAAAETAQVSLLTVAGKTLYRQALTLSPGSNPLAFSGLPLPAGLYLLHVQTPTGSVSQRVVVE